MKGRATDTFRRQHDELVRLAGVLAQLLDRTPLPVAEAQSALSRLAGVLKVHMAMEDEALYPRLLSHADPEVRAAAQRFRETFGGVYQAFLGYRARWSTVESMVTAPADFIRDTKAALAALGERVTHENDDLYARVDALFPLP